MELKIYSQDGTLKMTVSPSDSSTHVHELMGENVVNASFTSSEYVSLDVNDYLELEGSPYKLHTAYEPRQKSTQEYTYNIKFYGPESEVKRALMLYLTDGELEPKFSYEGSPRDHVQKVVDSLNYMEGGNRWVTGTVIDAPNLSLDYNNMFCDQALTELAGKLETEWWIEGYTVNLCRCEFGKTVELGYLHGLTNLQRSENNTDVRFFTRLIPLGSTKNIDKGLYGFKRLQLPGRERYVDKDADRYGVYPQVEEAAFEDIFPHRTGTLSEVRSEECTGENGKYVVWYFKDSGLDFDPNEYDLPGLVKHAVFKSGDLQGRDFEINFDSGKKEFEIITQYPDEESQLPGGNLIPASGDTYLLYNLRMPDEYYAPAEAEYKAAVDAFLAKYSTDTAIYRGDTDYVHILENGIALPVGRRVRLLSDNYFKETGYRDSRITKVTRKLNNLSQATIECTNAVGKGRMEVIESDVDSIKKMLDSQTDDLILSILRSWDSGDITDYKVFSALRTVKEILNRAISRVNDDTAAGVITFLKGLLIGKKGHGISVSDSGAVTAVFDELKNLFSLVSPDFVSGDLGNGFLLKYDPKTGRSYLEVDDLLVRKVAYFIELIIKRLSYVGGEIVLTPAGMKCSKVEVYDKFYRCYFEQDDGDRSIVQEFKAGDQARCQTFNVEEGVSHNVSNTYYWRLVTATGKNYIDLSIEDCDTGSMEPSAGDHIVQLGNRTDATRQNAIILSTVGDDAPSLKQYKGINGYTLRNKEVTILSPTLNKFLGQFISEVTGKSYDDMFSELQADFQTVKDQVDREFTIWFFEYTPTLGNIPASDWTTSALRELHEQDMFYDKSSGLAYRFEKSADGSYGWNSITDQQTVKALENAAKAQDTADGKRRVFVGQPTAGQAYDVGDLWVNATYSGGGVSYDNDTLRCLTAKAAGTAFSIAHWTPASNATTAYIKNLGDSILLVVSNTKDELNGLITQNRTSTNEAINKANAAAKDASSAMLKATEGVNGASSAMSKAIEAFNNAGAAQNAADNANGQVVKNATAIEATDKKITALAAKVTFDANGNITNINKSGLVTTADLNTLITQKFTFDANGKVTNISTSGLVTTSDFAGLFASQATEDGLVKKADISTFITADQAGTLISNATIQADRINFTGKTIINGNFVVDTNGALKVKNMFVTDGCMIAGFKVNGVNMVATSDTKTVTLSPGSIRFSDSKTGSIYIGTSDYESLNTTLVNVNSAATGSTGLYINAGTGYAIIARGKSVFLDVELMGLSFNVRNVSSGGNLSQNDDFVIFTNMSDIEVGMPILRRGKILYIKKINSGKKVVLKGNFRVSDSASTTTNRTISSEVSLMYIYDGYYWVEFFCG